MHCLKRRFLSILILRRCYKRPLWGLKIFIIIHLYFLVPPEIKDTITDIAMNIIDIGMDTLQQG
jgi:hypothetical protein